jgi:hypothetical protein
MSGRISGEPDQNHKPSTIIWDSVRSTTFAQQGDSTLGAAYTQIVDNSGTPLSSFSGLNLKSYDYISRSLSSATETWTFKSGGASGTVTNTVVIVYTDTTLATISTVTKT